MNRRGFLALCASAAIGTLAARTGLAQTIAQLAATKFPCFMAIADEDGNLLTKRAPMEIVDGMHMRATFPIGEPSWSAPGYHILAIDEDGGVAAVARERLGTRNYIETWQVTVPYSLTRH
jgi:hypothetical protein